MSLIGSIVIGGHSVRADAGGAPVPWSDFWYERVGHSASSGMRINPDTVKRIGTVLACVAAKSRQLAMLPCKIYTDIPGGGKRVVTDHPLYDVLYFQPNQFQTAFEFRQMMQAHVELRGNAYAEKIPGPRGPVDRLMPMHPDRVRVEMLSGSGRLRYIYNDPLTATTRTLMQDEVFHLRDFSDVYAVGQSRISMACEVFGVALAQQDYTARFLRNDARTTVAVTGTNFESQQAADEYRERFLRHSTGSNRGKPLILPAGLDIKTLSVSPVDAQLLDSTKASDVRICSIFNVLPHLVGVDAGKAATYASVEQFNIMNAQQSVLPMAIMWEQAIQRDLIISGRYYAKMSLASLLRGDTASRFAAYNAALATGWMCQDDVRELEDMNPIPDGVGKTFWRPLNWAPLAQLSTPAPPVQRTSGTGKSAPEPEDDDQAAEDGTGTGDQGQDGQARHMALQGQLQLLASDAAGRSVRREVSAVRKMIERGANSYQVNEFYCEHARYVVEALHLNEMAALTVKVECDARAQHLTMLLDQELHAEAVLWIENIAAVEPIKLSNLAVEGAIQS